MFHQPGDEQTCCRLRTGGQGGGKCFRLQDGGWQEWAQPIVGEEKQSKAAGRSILVQGKQGTPVGSRRRCIASPHSSQGKSLL